MKTLAIASLALALALSGCGSQGGSTSKNSSTQFDSKRDTCREITRLIGKSSDITGGILNAEVGSLPDLTGVAFSMGQVAKKTNDPELKSAALALQRGMKLMSNEATYFEGMQLYLGEIVPISTTCQSG